MLVISMIAVTGSKHEIINESIVGVSTTFNETICGTRKYPCIDKRQPFAHVVGRHWTAVVFTIDKNGKNKHFMSAVLVAQRLAIESIVVLRRTLYIITVE